MPCSCSVLKVGKDGHQNAVWGFFVFLVIEVSEGSMCIIKFNLIAWIVKIKVLKSERESIVRKKLSGGLK